MAHQRGCRAGLPRLGNIVVAVYPLAGDGHKQVAPAHQARVNLRAGHRGLSIGRMDGAAAPGGQLLK